ncbi:MAG: DUF3450 domain-containing protein [Gammaproteobacteria bacterium]|nr:DUF3450 domain-containing protein [Gammaproteobacteria bacterium]
MLGVLVGFSSAVSAQDQIEQVVGEGLARNQDAVESQQRIDATAGETEKLASRYRRELKVIDGLKVYNALLQKQVDDQNQEKLTIRESIDEIAVVERQIFPLMLRMANALEQFVELDRPFHLEERRKRVADLKAYIGDAGISAAEKLRLVLEAYRIETSYGSDLDEYSEVLEINGQERPVNILRFGRMVLVYQTDDGKENGVWDQATRQWAPLEAPEFRNYIRQGLKIARKQLPPDIFILPVSAAE